MNFKLPQAVIYILNTLESAGYEAYCVGGCVRDLIRGKTPADYDIATKAPVEEIERLFSHTVPTGIQHGTVTVLIDHQPFEVTRYRVDGEYHDHRRPDSVKFTNSFIEDLSRRDFTVNAMGFSPLHGLCDPFGGCDDIKAGILRAVGEPQKRFFEDALRILRAVRFSSVLGFTIEPKTFAAALRAVPLLNDISAERVTVELLKTLGGKRPSALLAILQNGGFSSRGIKWDISSSHGEKCDIKTNNAIARDERTGERSKRNIKDNDSPPQDVQDGGALAPLDRLPNDRLLRMAALLYLTKSNPDDCLKALRFSNSDAQRVIAYHEVFCEDDLTLPQMKPLCAVLRYEGLLLAAEGFGILKGRETKELQEEIKAAQKRGDPYTVKMLAIDGNRLKGLGFLGTQIGEMQKILLHSVLSDPSLNQEDALLKIAKGHLKEMS